MTISFIGFNPLAGIASGFVKSKAPDLYGDFQHFQHLFVTSKDFENKLVNRYGWPEEDARKIKTWPQYHAVTEIDLGLEDALKFTHLFQVDLVNEYNWPVDDALRIKGWWQYKAATELSFGVEDAEKITEWFQVALALYQEYSPEDAAKITTEEQYKDAVENSSGAKFTEHQFYLVSYQGWSAEDATRIITEKQYEAARTLDLGVDDALKFSEWFQLSIIEEYWWDVASATSVQDCSTYEAMSETYKYFWGAVSWGKSFIPDFSSVTEFMYGEQSDAECTGANCLHDEI